MDPGPFQGTPKGARTEAAQRRGGPAGTCSQRLENGALIPPPPSPPKPSPSYRAGVQRGTWRKGGVSRARGGRTRQTPPPCPPHAPHIPAAVPHPPRPERRGRPPVSSCLCHLLFIDCRGLHRGGRPGVPGAEGQRGRAGGRRSERTGGREPRHTGASATWTSGHPGDVGRTRGRVLMAGAHQQGPRCPWPAPETQRRPGACILGERGAVVSSRRRGDGFHQLAGAGGRGHPEATAPQAEAPSPPVNPLEASSPREEEKEMSTGKATGGDTPLSAAPPADGPWGRRGAAEAKAELRTRAQSWASPPATRGWLSRCGQRPHRTGPWGRRRSACRPPTGSRRAPTGPRWTADGSGGGTRGRCSRGRPGPGTGRGTVRGSTAGGRRPSMVKAPRGLAQDAPRGGVGGQECSVEGSRPLGCRSRPAWGQSLPWTWLITLISLETCMSGSDPPQTGVGLAFTRDPHPAPRGQASSSGLGVVWTTAPRMAQEGRGGRHGGRASHPRPPHVACPTMTRKPGLCPPRSYGAGQAATSLRSLPPAGPAGREQMWRLGLGPRLALPAQPSRVGFRANPHGLQARPAGTRRLSGCALLAPLTRAIWKERGRLAGGGQGPGEAGARCPDSPASRCVCRGSPQSPPAPSR